MNTRDIEGMIALLRSGEENLRMLREQQEALLALRRMQDDAIRLGQEAIERQSAWFQELQGMMFPGMAGNAASHGTQTSPQNAGGQQDYYRPRDTLDPPTFDFRSLPIEQIKAGAESFSKMLGLFEEWKRNSGNFPPRR
jgi:hypothetical protein